VLKDHPTLRTALPVPTTLHKESPKFQIAKAALLASIAAVQTQHLLLPQLANA
jgi:hypothetical protein